MIVYVFMSITIFLITVSRDGSANGIIIAYRQISDKNLTKTNYIACIYVINDRTT